MFTSRVVGRLLSLHLLFSRACVWRSGRSPSVMLVLHWVPVLILPSFIPFTESSTQQLQKGPVSFLKEAIFVNRGPMVMPVMVTAARLGAASQHPTSMHPQLLGPHAMSAAYRENSPACLLLFHADVLPAGVEAESPLVSSGWGTFCLVSLNQWPSRSSLT